jgi:REP element-mobilizing transposase RayT
MSRPLRIKFPGAIYHVTSRGDRRELIFENDSDRAALLSMLAAGMQRVDSQVLAYCQMDEHDHFYCTLTLRTVWSHRHPTAAIARWGICSQAASRSS